MSENYDNKDYENRLESIDDGIWKIVRLLEQLNQQTEVKDETKR